MHYAYSYAPPAISDQRMREHASQHAREHAPPHAQQVAGQPQRAVASCPYCGHTGAVVARREVGLCNWMSAFLMALLGLVPFCIIPFCCTSCKDRVFRCNNCGAVLGRQRP